MESSEGDRAIGTVPSTVPRNVCGEEMRAGRAASATMCASSAATQRVRVLQLVYALAYCRLFLLSGALSVCALACWRTSIIHSPLSHRNCRAGKGALQGVLRNWLREQSDLSERTLHTVPTFFTFISFLVTFFVADRMLRLAPSFPSDWFPVMTNRTQSCKLEDHLRGCRLPVRVVAASRARVAPDIHLKAPINQGH